MRILFNMGVVTSMPAVVRSAAHERMQRTKFDPFQGNIAPKIVRSYTTQCRGRTVAVKSRYEFGQSPAQSMYDLDLDIGEAEVDDFAPQPGSDRGSNCAAARTTATDAVGSAWLQGSSVRSSNCAATRTSATAAGVPASDAVKPRRTTALAGTPYSSRETGSILALGNLLRAGASDNRTDRAGGGRGARKRAQSEKRVLSTFAGILGEARQRCERAGTSRRNLGRLP